VTDLSPNDDRRARGLAKFREVYGDRVLAPPPGAVACFDLLVIDQQFAEVWTRPALSIPSRRLLVMGVLAEGGHFETLGIQFRRALETGELTPEQVREVVIHLVSYVGTPASAALIDASETAIAAHLESSTDETAR
jgi:4-carboxymuconolactone decarboxylase